MTPSRPVSPSLPQGQEQTLLALAASMQRGLVAASVVTGAASVAVAALVAGVPGAISAFAGVVLVVLASLFTLWLMRRTAAKEPGAVMMAIFAGYVQKMIFLLVGLFGLGSVDGVHRMSLALTTMAMLLAIAAAEGWAGYRQRTIVVDPEPTPATSGSTTGLPDSGPVTPAGRDEVRPAPSDPGQ